VTDARYRHLVLIIDRSGSMHAVEADMNGGIRRFITEQSAVDGRATISLYQFDTEHDTVLDFAELSADVLGSWQLVPRGGTALLDAAGTAVQRTGEKLASLPEDQRPGNVVVVIVTDGAENSSREYTLPQVREMILRQREEYDWVFMYLGANVDAFGAGGAMGIAADNTAGYAQGNAAMAFAAASSSVTRGYTGHAAGYGFTDKERDQLQDE
jgi:Mg-chelatase subunit ChlD